MPHLTPTLCAGIERAPTGVGGEA